jgi:hypothetical protein
MGPVCRRGVAQDRGAVDCFVNVAVQGVRPELILHSLDERPSPHRHRFAPLWLPFGLAARQGRLDPLVLQLRQLVVRRSQQAAERRAIDDAVACGRLLDLVIAGFEPEQ